MTVFLIDPTQPETVVRYGVDEILSHLDVVTREHLDHYDDLSHLDAAIDALSHGALMAAGYLLSDINLNLIVEDLPDPAAEGDGTPA